MIRGWVGLCLCYVSLSMAMPCAVRDDEGHRIELSQPARRIISLSPHLTESLYAIGAGSSIVGVVAGSDYPKEANTKPIVGRSTGLSVESIWILKPDLIVTWGRVFDAALTVFKEAGIPVYVSNPHRLADVSTEISHLGCLTGQNKEARRLVSQFKQREMVAKRSNQSGQSIKVFYALSVHPLMTVGRASWIADILHLCQGVPVHEPLHLATAVVNPEALVQNRPEIIFYSNEDPRALLGPTFRYQWINAGWIERPGPRLILGMESVCKAVHSLSM